jgi:hypothetical protein
MNPGAGMNTTYRKEAIRQARGILEADPVYLDT